MEAKRRKIDDGEQMDDSEAAFEEYVGGFVEDRLAKKAHSPLLNVWFLSDSTCHALPS
jgi:hypothetical protein